MNLSASWRSATLLATLCAPPLALAQEVADEVGQAGPPPFGFIAAIVGFGVLIPIAIVAIINLNEYRQERERLALIERLTTAGHAVPPEIVHRGPPKLTLAEERRRDVRRGITLLCWALGLGLVLYLLTPPGPFQLRAPAWGLLFLILALGSFLKAWLTAREIARGASDAAR